MSPARSRIALLAVPIVSLSVGTTLWFAIARGQDFNWDQRNYHIGIPFLLSTGQFWHSVMPAGLVSYLNPYLLQVQFWTLQHLSPIHFVVVLALLQSLAFVLSGVFCAVLSAPTGERRSWPVFILGFALCLLSPAAVSEAGTTFIDLLTAIPVLVAYLLLLTRGRRFTPLTAGVLAGALLGTAISLKLTNAVFVFGVMGFAITGTDSLRQRLVWLPACAAATIVAYLTVALPWDVDVWQHFGNPIFPYFNGIFHSPDFPATNFHDRHFTVHSVFDIWIYPLDWVHPWGSWYRLITPPHTVGMSMPTLEVALGDGRWLVAVTGITLFLAAIATFRRWGATRLRDPASGLLLAFAIDYLVWLFTFDIIRYAVVLSILCGAVILIFAMTLPSPRMRIVVLGVIVIAQAFTAFVPDWDHVPWKPTWQAFVHPKLDLGHRPLVFLTAQPTLFLAASLPSDARYVGVASDLSASNHTALTAQLRKDLEWSDGRNLYSIDLGTTSPLAAQVLSSDGVQVSGNCTRFHIAEYKYRICKLTDRGTDSRLAPSLSSERPATEPRQ